MLPSQPRFAIFCRFTSMSTHWLMIHHLFMILGTWIGLHVIALPRHGFSKCSLLISPILFNWFILLRRFGMNSIECMVPKATLPQRSKFLKNGLCYKELKDQSTLSMPLFVVATLDIAEQNQYREELLVSLFLNSIPTALNAQIRSSILGGATLPSLADVFNAAQRVESLTPTKTSSSALTPSESSALLTFETTILLASDRGSSSRSHSSNDREKRRSKYTGPPCIHCSRSTHSSARCYQKWGYPPGHPHHVPSTSIVPHLPTISPGLLPSPSANMITLSQADYDRLIQGRSSAALAQTPVGISSQGPGTALLASSTSTWIIDSGASNHMSGSDSLLSRISKLPKPENVFIVDGQSCSVTRKGSTSPTQLPLQDVLYVLNFPFNLISISALTKALLCYVTFFPYHYIFQDLRTGVQIGLGRKTHDRLYELVSNQPSRGLTCSLSRTASSLDWHHHLGHPSLTKLRQALPLMSIKPFLCESCEMGKHHRATFSCIESIPSSKPFDLVHCNIWGPSRLPSLLGFCYYMVLIDDYSRVSWVYLLKYLMDIMWPISQSHFHVSCLCSLKWNLFIAILVWCLQWSPWACAMTKWIMMRL